MSERSRIIEEMRETAQGLQKTGIIDARRMREYEALYRASQVPQYTGDSVKELRVRLNISQTVLAHVINTSAATVRAWEAGTKRPGGPSCKLLHILDRKGLEVFL
jgi:putative transcriptional regulator